MTAAWKLILRPIRAETRRVGALTAWVRRARPPGNVFGYHRDLHLILWTAWILTVVEGALAHLILVLIFGHPPWVWIVLGLHIYGVYWLFGLLAGMMTRPHTVDGETGYVRESGGCVAEIPLAAIMAVTVGDFPDFAHSRRAAINDGRVLSMAGAAASLRLDLADDASVVLDKRPMSVAPQRVYLSADNPRELAAELRSDRAVTSKTR